MPNGTYGGVGGGRKSPLPDSLFKLPPAEAFFVLNADCCANKKERAAAHAFFYAFATAPYLFSDG